MYYPIALLKSTICADCTPSSSATFCSKLSVPRFSSAMNINFSDSSPNAIGSLSVLPTLPPSLEITFVASSSNLPKSESAVSGMIFIVSIALVIFSWVRRIRSLGSGILLLFACSAYILLFRIFRSLGT